MSPRSLTVAGLLTALTLTIPATAIAIADRLPVAGPLTLAATGPAAGTVVLIHRGGWSGPDPSLQAALLDDLGRELAARGANVISLDYAAGAAGVWSIVTQLDAITRTTAGPLCVYGESAGGHLALMAAARLHRLRCLITLGAPTDLLSLPETTTLAGVAWMLANTAFAHAPGGLTAYSPITWATQIRARIWMLRQADDLLIGPEQPALFAAAVPSTTTITLEAGRGPRSLDAYLHGSLSPHARRQLISIVFRALGGERRSREHVRSRGTPR
jgi:hypothetical protein